MTDSSRVETRGFDSGRVMVYPSAVLQTRVQIPLSTNFLVLYPPMPANRRHLTANRWRLVLSHTTNRQPPTAVSGMPTAARPPLSPGPGMRKNGRDLGGGPRGG